jgi:hypothetical protein
MSYDFLAQGEMLAASPAHWKGQNGPLGEGNAP